MMAPSPNPIIIALSGCTSNKFPFQIDRSGLIRSANKLNIPNGMLNPDSPEPAHPARVKKKGLGSCSKLTTPEELGHMKLGWYYNWRPFQLIDPVPGVEFVPMFWSDQDLTPENFAAVEQSSATHVLGFNEPDMEGQSNMTPEQCLDLWPQLMKVKQRLGSPAPANSAWMANFMPEARRRGLRIDFVCLHRYPDISNPKAVDQVEAMIREAYEKYGLPVWLTECGAADVAQWHQPQVSKPTPEMAQDFVIRLLAMLERLPYVERYAWFADRVAKAYSLGTIFEMQGKAITTLGEVYRDNS